jgi:hypothetical protein
MGFLRRLVGGDRLPLPEWSPFDDGRTHQEFLDAVQADLRRRGVEDTMGDGFVDVESPETGHDVRLGLTNLAQSCALSPRYDWSSVISSHFDVVLKLDRARDDAGRDFEGLVHCSGFASFPMRRWEVGIRRSGRSVIQRSVC